jgi:hypothetical protein
MITPCMGKRFGKLIVIGCKPTNRHGHAMWLCQCDCGNTTVVSGNSLRSERIQSCGCNHARGFEPGSSAFRAIRQQYQTNAKVRNHAFDLTDPEFKVLVDGNCYYCGSAPSAIKRISGNGQYIYNGVDRVDNTLGYTVANCVSCCSHCNMAKRTLSQDDFLGWISKVYTNIFRKI